jgi:hypothetical protein
MPNREATGPQKGCLSEIAFSAGRNLTTCDAPAARIAQQVLFKHLLCLLKAWGLCHLVPHINGLFYLAWLPFSTTDARPGDEG